ncbi:alpha/beta hydrolase [Nocardia bhagyanarayanae]|uniref:S-formylglutathione hydrolase FrmB n=1 Tax=Nocardia bhagyanarayanae TaxID=1215925 RepID=A0A543FE73_9NOCA|nr:alpha/beta hydrolase family protein [Nocardia bhagyanarayanae]TQM32036.1 S-formylglutathione hydrolase FrmB [Nocardia bhagyanarayanae]
MSGPIRIALAIVSVLAGVALTFVPRTPADAAGIVRWEARVSDRVLDIGISSPNLEDPDWSVKVVRLLLPPGWSKDANRTWPTVWVLHGGFDDHKSWTDKGDLEALTKDANAIFVLPETSWCSAYSDWYNNGAWGAPAWEKYLLEDVRTILESTYKANTTRAIAGNSMGGLGAMKFAAEYQGMFRSAASFSGNVDPLHASGAPGDPDKPGQGCAADWKRVWGDYNIPAQRAIWEQNNPYSQAAKLTGKPLFVSYGRSGAVEEAVYQQNYRFVDRLQQLGATVDERYVEGHGHDWPAWRAQMQNALGMLLTSVGA